MQDMITKGRAVHAAGEDHSRAKLAAKDVLKILNLLRAGRGQQELARRFGVSSPTINNIKMGKTWSSLTRILYRPRARS
jgi:hypothetical protein